MRLRTFVILVSVLACLAAPTRAAAQERSGLWFGIGGGFGSAGLSCDGCGFEDRFASGAAYLKGGWTLNPQALVGIEFNAWSKKVTDDSTVIGTLNLYNVSGTITYYPQATSGFFIKGGAGGSKINSKATQTGTTVSVDFGSGFGFIVGGGYDIPVARRVAITTAINLWAGNLGDLKANGVTFATGAKQNVLDLTIGVTFP